MGFLAGKRALVIGVANNRSIAWGIAKQMAEQGAEVALTYQIEKIERKIKPLAEEVGPSLCFQMDATKPDEVEATMQKLDDVWPEGFDILVHSIAFAPREELEGSFTDNTTRDGFAIAHEVSAYTLVSLSKAAKPALEKRKGSILTVSYLGAVKAVPNYNVMGVAKASLEACVRYLAADLGPLGIRVNAISAGPIRTLAAAGIGDFRRMLEKSAAATPLRQNVTIFEVGNTAAFLCSDLASGISGEITYVDGGYNIVASV